MGYRNYFYIVRKEDLDKIRNLKLSELKKNMNMEFDDDSLSFIELTFMKKVFEFGGRYDNNIDSGTSIFTYSETSKYFREYNSVIVDKKSIKLAIDFYQKELVNYYEELRDALENYNDKENSGKIISHIVSKSDEWLAVKKMMNIGMDKDKAEGIFLPYNLDENEDSIVKSDLFEYKIFELVRLYKTIDLENNYLIFCGY